MGGHQLGLLAVALAGLVLSGCAAQPNTPPPVIPSIAFTAPTTVPATTTTTTAPIPAGAEGVTVTRVVDGDTFEVAGGRRIRVLGIDSCEADTEAGQQAKRLAETTLMDPRNGPITLTREPGVGTDRNDRELRYVQMGGVDFGTYMVMYPHTGVYERGDASEAYLSELRESAVGRSCSGEPAPSPTTTSNVPDNTYVEVDVEDDDDNRESRFCRGRWWC